MHISGEGKQETLHASGAGIGILEDPVFEQKTIHLAAGDRLFLFCDSILEASNENGAQFLDDQLATCLRATTDMTTEESMEYLIQSVAEWAHGPQDDDISALMMQVDRAMDKKPGRSLKNLFRKLK
jgi:serine phosphatase RsbU (regulator of sigma subunit)